jgi:hypothetical protein
MMYAIPSRKMKPNVRSLLLNRLSGFPPLVARPHDQLSSRKISARTVATKKSLSNRIPPLGIEVYLMTVA